MARVKLREGKSFTYNASMTVRELETLCSLGIVESVASERNTLNCVQEDKYVQTENTSGRWMVNENGVAREVGKQDRVYVLFKDTTEIRRQIEHLTTKLEKIEAYLTIKQPAD